MLQDDDLLVRLDTGALPDELGPQRTAMLRYVEKLTRTPDAMVRADVDALRSAGFDDRDVLEICEVAAYYAYVNRIADGLGVDLEPWTRDDE